MVKLHRGDVIEVLAPDGKGGLKSRPVIVLHNVPKNADAVSVYCTTQNDGDEKNTIFVSANSIQGKEMGITKDTYIRPKKILTIPAKSIRRLIGK